MAYYYALSAKPLPASLHGADGEYSIRTLADDERLAIEDYFFRKDVRIALKRETSAVIVPQGHTVNATLENFAVLVEFALAVLTVSGFQPITIVGALGGSKCTGAIQRGYQSTAEPPKFPKKLVKAAASTWVRHLFAARLKSKDKLHITADRFVRYSKSNNSSDALVDLCICLESLIESQVEISFRFATCLAKVTQLENAEQISNLLSELYDLRSKVVHGTDFTKEHKKVIPNIAKVRLAARAILTTYVLYLTDHTKDEWKKHLRSSLFA